MPTQIFVGPEITGIGGVDLITTPTPLVPGTPQRLITVYLSCAILPAAEPIPVSTPAGENVATEGLTILQVPVVSAPKSAYAVGSQAQTAAFPLMFPAEGTAFTERKKKVFAKQPPNDTW